jgi:hypothetical protein
MLVSFLIDTSDLAAMDDLYVNWGALSLSTRILIFDPLKNREASG